MANTKFIISKLKIEDVVRDVIARSEAEYVAVDYKGTKTTLASALASIVAELSNLPTDTGIDEKISAAIDELIGGAPDTYDTLKEIADYIAEHEDVTDALNAAIGNKVDKEDGKGLSAEDFTTVLKAKLENMPTITTEDVETWNNKVDKVTGKGLSSNDFTTAEKEKLASIPEITETDVANWNNKAESGVRYGSEIPADLKNGELFVQTVTTE